MDLAITRDGEVVGFVMWAVDDDASRCHPASPSTR